MVRRFEGERISCRRYFRERRLPTGSSAAPAADQIYGLGLNDKLYGGGGNDWLVGGLGGDFLVGGLGDDAYDVDSVRDQVVGSAFEGIDRVRAWISHELTANVEILDPGGRGQPERHRQRRRTIRSSAMPARTCSTAAPATTC